MMTKPLLLAVVLLCCCVTTLHASRKPRCKCIRTSSYPINVRVITKIEVIPISGNCRRMEIIVTRSNGSKVCVNPQQKWINDLMSNLQRTNVTSSSATVSPAASTISF